MPKDNRHLSTDRSIIQSSTVRLEQDYADEYVFQLMVGIILDVTPADLEGNRSADQSVERRGFIHECSVLVIDDGSQEFTVLDNVLLTPNSASGIDNYEEQLPRPSIGLVTGDELDSSLQEIDPHDLDGDRCVVGFIGGRLDSPFILSWWPHSRNVYDVATSGGGVDENLLDQDRRYFRRVNGVETLITSTGNVLWSTTWANSSIDPSNTATEGRIHREPDPDLGGSVKVHIKPTQTFELAWDPQVEGMGVNNVFEPEVPQTNPADPEPTPPEGEPEFTYIYIDQDQVDIFTPANILLKAGERAGIQAPLIHLENEYDAAVDPIILGEEHRQWFLNTFRVLSPFGPLQIDPTTVQEGSPYDDTLSEISFVE